MIRKTLTILSLIGLLLSVCAAGCGVLDLINSQCITDADCDDGLFCNGVETCDVGLCQIGTPPCPMPDEAPECGVYCNEAFGACIAPSCISDADCDDGDFCTGPETCVECACVAGEPPDCDDGIDCTDDTCVEGQCLSTSNDANCPEDAPFCVDENPDLPLGYERQGCRGCCDPCLSQCELGLGVCLDRDFEEFEDFSATRERWLEEVSEFGCDDLFPFLVAGECSNHSELFLFRGEGLTTLTHYFSPDTEGFISLTTGTDGIGPICLGVGYWPEHLECTNAVITEVLCGTQIEVGDTFDLP